MNRRVITISGAIFFTLFGLLALWLTRQILTYLLFSLFLGATLRPIVDLAQSKTKFYRLGIYFLVGLAILTAFFLIYRVSGLLGDELNRITENIASMENWHVPFWLARLLWVRTLFDLLPAPALLFEAGTGDGGQTLLPVLETTSKSVLAVLSGTLIITFLSIYWVSSQDHFQRLWLSLLPSETRQKARAIWQHIVESLGAYGRFLAAQFLLTWIVISTGSHLLGSPFPVLAGLAVAISSLVPIIGIPLALVVKFFTGLLAGYTFTPWIMLFVTVVLVLMRLFIWPGLYKKKWDSPILSLVLALAFAQAFGLRWTLLAPPLAAILTILWSQLVVRGKSDQKEKDLELIVRRRADLSEALAALEGDIPPALSSNLATLDELLARAGPILEE